MAKRSYNTYTDEYRREAVDYVLSSGRPITECARELGLNSKTLNDWVLKFQRAGRGDEAAGTDGDEARRLREAERRIRQLEEENEFLKKAAAFFARSRA